MSYTTIEEDRDSWRERAEKLQKAKEENDERFQLEAQEWKAKAERYLGALKFYEDQNTYAVTGAQCEIRALSDRGYIARKAIAQDAETQK